eukprot:TRINITY_DN1134_c0_g1_i2.p1 TRINITY_DN1134_c0_g1~~TRINITY_DN1134_c0_g1_i2.p1  ORF type:complete len:129 (-),score=33.64 TRINITY_DN1134_c0_g1_i2:1571-1957(-)
MPPLRATAKRDQRPPRGPHRRTPPRPPPPSVSRGRRPRSPRSSIPPRRLRDHRGNNRFLILQGEVEQIAMMKPKGKGQDTGLLEYLEEIIGTDKYMKPIEETATVLENLNEERNEKFNRVKIAVKRIT